jgi:hypothetical protein
MKKEEHKYQDSYTRNKVSGKKTLKKPGNKEKNKPGK